MDQIRCAQCGAAGGAGSKKKLLRCARCKLVWYCGRECQLAHRKAHKAGCRAPPTGAVEEERAKKAKTDAAETAAEAAEDTECCVCFEPVRLEAPYTCAHEICALCAPRSRSCPLCRAPFPAVAPSADLPPRPDLGGAGALREPGAWRERGADALLDSISLRSVPAGEEAATFAEVEEIIYFDGRPLTAGERALWDAELAAGRETLTGHNGSGWTRLHQLAATTVQDVRATIDLLAEWVAAGLDPNARTAPGPAGHTNFTPAHLACQYNNARLLAKNHDLGADLSLLSNAGRSPLAVAINGGCLRCFWLCVRHGPARGVLHIDDAGAAHNLCDLLGAACEKHSARPGRHCELEPAAWRRAWAWARKLAPPIRAESAAAFDRGVAALERGPPRRPISALDPSGCPTS